MIIFPDKRRRRWTVHFSVIKKHLRWLAKMGMIDMRYARGTLPRRP
jgi:hypothetical protein